MKRFKRFIAVWLSVAMLPLPAGVAEDFSAPMPAPASVEEVGDTASMPEQEPELESEPAEQSMPESAMVSESEPAAEPASPDAASPEVPGVAESTAEEGDSGSESVSGDAYAPSPETAILSPAEELAAALGIPTVELARLMGEREGDLLSFDEEQMAALYRNAQERGMVISDLLIDVDGVLVRYRGEQTDVIVPEGVREIGDEAFRNLTQLRSVEFPASVWRAGKYAFASCAQLEKVAIIAPRPGVDEGLREIGERAFMDCSSLKEIELPETLEKIEDEAFLGCAALAAFEVPEHVESVGRDIFAGCANATDGEAEKESAMDAESIVPDGDEGIHPEDQDAWPILMSPGSISMQESLTLGVGESATLAVEFEPSYEGDALTFISEKPAIASVKKATGKITGNKVGTTVVRATSTSNASASCTVTVAKAPGKVTLSPTKATLGVGEEYEFTAKLPGGTASMLTAETSKASVATVKQTEPGKFTVTAGEKTGTATITVKTFNGKSAKFTATVKNAPVAGTLTISPAEHKLAVKQRVSLKASYAASYGGSYAWSIGEGGSALATVTPDGVVEATGAGSVTVLATSYNGITAESNLTIEPEPDRVELDATELTLGVGETFALKPVAMSGDTEVTQATFTYESHNKAFATVSGAGKITAKKAGKATITVKSYNEKSVECAVTVVKAPGKVKLSSAKATLGKGESYDFAATLPEGTASKLTTKTSNASVATVKQTEPGKFTVTAGEKAGTATITVKTFNGKSAKFTATVKEAPEAVRIEDSVQLGVGQTYTLTPSFEPTGADCNERYTSDDVQVVTVANGVLTAVGIGHTTIHVETFNGHSASCEVTVYAAPAKLSIANPVNKLGVKEKYQLHVASDSDEALLQYCTWKSSNAAVLAVNAKTGLLTAKKAGKAKITATMASMPGKPSASLNITVVSAPKKVTLSPAAITLHAGETAQLTAKLPKNTASQITWKSDVDTIASVENGLVTALSSGTTIITATTFNDHSAKCTVTVEGEHQPEVDPPVAPSIRINGSEAGRDVVELNGDVALSWSSAEIVDGYDVRVETTGGAAVLDLRATTETSATIQASSLISGETYTVRITAARNGQTSEAAVAQFRYVPSSEPAALSIVSVQADRESAQTSDPVTWTATVTGGVQPLTYAWEVRCGEEVECSGTSIGPELVYAPRNSGNYTAKLTATDASGKSVEATSAPLSVSKRPVSPIQDFTFNVLDDTHCEITGYKGSDTVLILPETDGEGHIVQKIGDGAFENNDRLRGVVLSSGIETIGKNAFFSCIQLRDVSLPEGLLTIQSTAFGYCALEQVHIPDSVTTLGDQAIYRCDKLQEVNYPKNLVSVDIVTGSVTPFCDCPLLKHMIVPEGVKEIPSYAFKGMNSLESIVLPGTLETCGMYAFSETSLTEIELPENMLKIGYSAFSDCALLKSVISDKVTEIDACAFSKCKSLTHVSLPEGLRIIRYQAFGWCTALEQIHIPDSVTTLGADAFIDCPNLKQVNYPKSWETVDLQQGTPFCLCPLLTRIVVPEGVTEIPGHAFNGMDSLESIELPETLKTISAYAFGSCRSLKKIELPEALETIGHCAFDYCTALCAVRIGANVNSIAFSAFSNCDPAKPTFYGKAGSYAQTWAEEKGFNFSTEEFPYTRVKLTGRVVMRDATPIPGVTVTIWEDADIEGTPIVVSTDENGDWSYDAAKALHEYFITYSKPGYELSIYKLMLTVGSTDTSAGIVYGATRFAPTVTFSGKIRTDAGTAVANAQVRITDASSGNTLALASSSEQGAWSANVPRTDEVCITYQAAGYTFSSNGILLPATGDQSVADAIATVSEALPTAPRIVSVKLPQESLETCTDLRILVQTSNAMAVILVVDGVRYETYPVIDDVATVIRAFSVGGERKVQFIPVSDEGEGEISDAQSLQIQTSGALPNAIITAQSEIYVGETFKISWIVPHAEAYKLRVYRDGEAIWIGEWIYENWCAIPGSIFDAPGAYSVLLSAEGKGYSQSDTSWPLTVSTKTVSIAVTSPKNNNTFVPGDIVYLTADNPNGEYVAFRITHGENVSYLPATGTINVTEPLDCLTVEEPGDYKIEVVAYADAERRGEIGSSAPVTIRVNGGTIYSCNVGSGQGTMLTSDITSLWCKTNNAVSEVNVYLDGKSYATLSDYTEDASFTRTFKKSIISPDQGLHTFRFEAVGSDEKRAARNFTFYAMYPYADTTKLFYPVDNNVELIGPYPVSPSTGYRLNKYTGVTIHGVYGDQYYIKTSSRWGFVMKSQLADRINTSTLVRSLHLALTKEDSDHQYVPMSGHLAIDWYCDEDIGENMYYEVCFVNPTDLKDEHVLYTGTETSMNATISDVPEGTYYIEVRLWSKEGTKAYQVAHADTSGNGNKKRMYIVYDDHNGQIVRSDHDSSKRLVSDAQNLAQNYAQLMAKTKADYKDYINSPGFQSWSWLFGDALDATQANTLKGVYLADRIMYSLSSNKNQGADIELDDMIGFFDFMDGWSEAIDGISDQAIADWFKTAVAVVYIRPDGYYFSTDDPNEINKMMKQMQADLHINGEWMKKSKVGIELANLLFSALQDYSVYTRVSPTDLENAVESLEKGKEDSKIIRAAWEILGSYLQDGKLNKSNIRTMLCVGYLGEFASDKIADAIRDILSDSVQALANSMGLGPFMVGCKVGAAIAAPVVDFALNIDGIQEKAYRVLWAMEAADEYSPVYLKAVREFESAPLANYGEMVKASATFCCLIGNVVQALYDHWDEVHSAPWQSICDFCSGYDVDAEKENHKRTVQFYKNFLKVDCENFYNEFVRPNHKAYVSWSN